MSVLTSIILFNTIAIVSNTIIIFMNNRVIVSVAKDR